MSLLITLQLIAACGRAGFDPVSDGPFTEFDGAISDAMPLGPFGTPTPIGELNSAFTDDDPTLAADRLEIFFASDRPGGQGASDIWTAVRSDPDQAWSPPTAVASLNSAGNDTCPFLSKDGLTIYLGSTRDTGVQIWTASRSSRGAAWSTPTVVAELAAPCSCAVVDGTNKAMVFQQFRGATGNDVLQTTRLSPTEPWATPVVVDELSTAAEDVTPWLSGDGRVIYFSSDRPGVGGRDLYRASRASATDSFVNVSPVVELNTPDHDTDPWLTEDERLIVFVRDNDLYEARR
jgi:Tol biopolymer transport system component